jgi:transcriptional regulator with XRE-family HTH domain
VSEILTGSKIASARKEKGLTQKQLAEQLHVSDKAVSKWERGLNYPDIALLKPLSEILDMSIAQLICDEKSSAESAVEKTITISQKEKFKIKRNLKGRSITIIVIGCIIFLALIYISSLIYDIQAYDLEIRGVEAHSLSIFPIFKRVHTLISMATVFSGLVIGHSINTLLNLKKI